jgi:hypothetical protein
MMEEVIHLSDLVADLKQRVEALERELAAAKHGLESPVKRDAPVDVYLNQGKQAELAARWDSGTYSEEDFRAP